MALFNNTREQPVTRQLQTSAPGQINMIGEGTVLEGTLQTEGDIRVSGRVVGKVRVGGKAIIAQEGSIEGELVAGSADVAGTIEGDMQIGERLVLRSSARVTSNVRAGRLVMEEGAVFNGRCVMGDRHVLGADGVRPDEAAPEKAAPGKNSHPARVPVG